MSVNLKMVGGIYFVTYAEHPDYIKIGRTKNYATRFKTYLTYTPFSLEVLLLIPRKNTRLFETKPSSFYERTLHRQFADDRHKNEWFLNTEELRKYIFGQRQKHEFEPFIYRPDMDISPMFCKDEELE